MKFCPDNCHWLTLTEFEQDETDTKDPHWCNRYGRQVFHDGEHPNLIKLDECSVAKYTLMWTTYDGLMMQHTVIAEDKVHALTRCLSNATINLILFDYLLQFESIDAQIQQFLWLRDGRIC